MGYNRSLGIVLLATGVCAGAPGCFSLSLGTRNCTGDHPEVKARLNSLEQRVSALEQMLGPAPSAAVNEAIPNGPPPIVMQPLP